MQGSGNGLTAGYVSQLFNEICKYISGANPVLEDAMSKMEGETDEDVQKERKRISEVKRHGDLIFSALKPLSHWEEGIGGVVHGGKM